MADLPELVGFFSYSRDDDADSQGALSALRHRIQGELRGQLGRTPKTFRLWQDKEAIASGTLWESEINNSIEQAVFFIPIITPTVAASPYCRFELDAFLAREAALGRSDLVFPILYIHVPALEDSARREKDAVLSLISKRQYVDWRELRHLDANSTEVKRAVERFCSHIRDALNKPWLSPEERVAQERASALRREEDERQRLEDEERRQEEEARKRAAAARERERADAERRQREEEAEQRRAAERRVRDEAKARRLTAEEQRRAEKEERRRLRSAEARLLSPPSRRALVAGSVICLGLIGAIAVWLADLRTPAPSTGPTPARVEPAPAPVASAPAPAALMPQASVKPAPAPVAPSPALVAPTPPAPVIPAPAPTAPTHLIANAPLTEEQEQALKSGDAFQECTSCPVMVVAPPGSFKMGSPASEPRHESNEAPQHSVTIVQQFAVGQFAVTFDEWDACVADNGCDRPIYPGPGLDNGWGRGRRPVINVSWLDAKGYVAWLSKKTGKTYRLLTEAEWEYAARAGSATAYSWGDTIGVGNANCVGCGSRWDDKETAPVGSFVANRFGLYDVHGNARQWVEDCYHENYVGAPSNGAAWRSDCKFHVLRGGAYDSDAGRAASRRGIAPGNRYSEWSFRVARTLGQVAPTLPAPAILAPAPSPPPPAPAAPTPPPPVVPAPAPAAPTQLIANAPLTEAQQHMLKRGDKFQECSNCPVMIVVPAGSFIMGSPASEPGHYSNEEPQHRVTIARQFAVGQFEVTFDEWDACVADGGCEKPVYPGPGLDDGWGRGRRPVLYVSWRDAEGYAKWLSRKTGGTYRLLTEAEWEYAARAGGTSAYWWGDAVGSGNANCKGCGSQWDDKQTAPVDSFAANPFGLFDVHGNARQWVEDCNHPNYVGAPSNGSAWMSGECTSHVLRGGAYSRDAKYCRAASRGGVAPGGRYSDQSFRVARTLGP